LVPSGLVHEDGSFTVRVKQNGTALVVRACGELDIASSKMLEDELRRAIGGDATAIVLDLARLSFIDSTGLRALLVAAEPSRSNGRRLRMVHAPAVLQRLVQVSGVEDLLPLDDD
jgi:anti-anti-sigma factor